MEIWKNPHVHLSWRVHLAKWVKRLKVATYFSCFNIWNNLYNKKHIPKKSENNFNSKCLYFIHLNLCILQIYIQKQKMQKYQKQKHQTMTSIFFSLTLQRVSKFFLPGSVQKIKYNDCGPIKVLICWPIISERY